MATLNYFIKNDFRTALENHNGIVIEAKFAEDEYRIAYRIGKLSKKAEFISCLKGLPENIEECSIREFDLDPSNVLHIYLKDIMNYEEFKECLKTYEMTEEEKAYNERIKALFAKRGL